MADDVPTEPRMTISSPAGLTTPNITLEEAERADNMVGYDGDVERGVRGGEDGSAMEEEEGGRDERVVDGNLEVGQVKEKVGNLFIIKDEIDVEDSIILSDLEYDIPDEDGGTGEDDGGENQCKVSRSSDGASAPENSEGKEFERNLKNPALKKSEQKVSENRVKNPAFQKRTDAYLNLINGQQVATIDQG